MTNDELIRAALRGAVPAWPHADDAAARTFVDEVRQAGLAPLVHHHLARAGARAAWPLEVISALAADAREIVARDLLREREVIDVVARLAAARIDALLLKGTPLAYTHYPEPALRTRIDTDVFVRADDRGAAARVLEDAGYARAGGVAGEFVSYQDAYRKSERGIDQVIDLHWQINNGQVFAQALPFDEAWAASVAVPALGTAARTLAPPHALLLAAMHRAAHVGSEGREGERLLWLYDAHLIATALREDEWDTFVALCARKRMRAVGRDLLERTIDALATPVPERVLGSLSAPGPRELSARYLAGRRGDVVWTDLRALPTWGARLELMRELLLPRRAYMLAKYGTQRRWLLPWLYVRRAVEGALKHVRP